MAITFIGSAKTKQPNCASNFQPAGKVLVPKDNVPMPENLVIEKLQHTGANSDSHLAARRAKCKSDVKNLSSKELQAKYNREYSSWSNAKHRAKNIYHVPFASEFNVFRCFLEYVGPRPNIDDSLDRIIGNQGYVPGNVRWASKQLQSENRKSVSKLMVNGEEMTIPQLAVLIGKKPDTVRKLLKKGLSADELLERARNNHHSIPRRRRKVSEWPWPDNEYGEQWERLYRQNNRGQKHRVLFFIDELKSMEKKIIEEFQPGELFPDDVVKRLDQIDTMLKFAMEQKKRVIAEQYKYDLYSHPQYNGGYIWRDRESDHDSENSWDSHTSEDDRMD